MSKKIDCKGLKCGHPNCISCNVSLKNTDFFNTQVGGDHYTLMKYQPLEIVLANEGYEAFRGACLTKILKYVMRKKDDALEQYKKARHVLDLLIKATEEKS